MRAIGATVQTLAAVGDGCPDLLVGWMGRNLLLEVKDGSKPPSQQRLNDRQLRWHREWRGRVTTVASVEEALEVLGVMV